TMQDHSHHEHLHNHSDNHGADHTHGSVSRRGFLSLAIPSIVLAKRVLGQGSDDMAARFRKMSEDAERSGLAEPYKGITTDGHVAGGLFQIEPTHVSTEPVRNAAEKFISSLTSEQRAKTMFAIDDPEWRKWMNQHFYVRQGVSFKEMNDAQREVAFGLLRSSLSARGMALTRNIMRLNETLAELTNDHEFMGEWLYHITIMGKPSATEPWGWQLDGHHAIINYFVLGDQVVMTPHFMGSEPVIATSGKYKGTAILQEEQKQGLAMIQRLNDAQRKKAIINFSKTGNNNLTEAFKDNVVLDYAGVRASEFNAQQQRAFLELADLYIGNMDEGHARVKVNEIKRHMSDTWFAWIGATEADSIFYYRIHSPVVLIEFDHQRPANLARFVADPKQPTRQH